MNECCEIMNNHGTLHKTDVCTSEMASKKIYEYKYSCIKCNFKCVKHSDWERHLTTKKHNKQGILEIVGTPSSPHICACGRTYSTRYRLNMHQKGCQSATAAVASSATAVAAVAAAATHTENALVSVSAFAEDSRQLICINDTEENIGNNLVNMITQRQGPHFKMTTDFIMELIHQNHELKNLLLEEREARREDKEEIIHIIDEKMDMLSSKQTTVTNTTQFNLNIFLNEKCKDAISLTQFVNSLNVGPQHVEYTGVHGYVAGISKIFMDGLRDMDVCERPIHCTDLKREVLYIKEDNVWEKDNPEKSKFQKAIDTIVRKNMQQVSAWVNQNPSCEILDTNEYHLHLNIMRQCIGGGISQEHLNNRKIMRNIAKEVFINKHSAM